MLASFSVEAEALECVCCVEIPTELVKILATATKVWSWIRTKREGSHYIASLIVKHFFGPLFAVVHAAVYAQISLRIAQGAFIPKRPTADRCIMVMCPSERLWYRGLWDKKTRDINRTKFVRSKRFLGALGPRMFGVTKKRRLHDATNAYLSMKHNVAKQAANELALNVVDNEFFEQRMSLAVVTVTDEDWRDEAYAMETCMTYFCETFSAFQPEMGGIGKKEKNARAPVLKITLMDAWAGDEGRE